jgi:hypothetical protein
MLSFIEGSTVTYPMPSVPLIGRMIERATENAPPLARSASTATGTPRFARDPGHFATHKPAGRNENVEQAALSLEGGVA